jgi:hypothetical protein
VYTFWLDYQYPISKCQQFERLFFVTLSSTIGPAGGRGKDDCRGRCAVWAIAACVPVVEVVIVCGCACATISCMSCMIDALVRRRAQVSYKQNEQSITQKSNKS